MFANCKPSCRQSEKDPPPLASGLHFSQSLSKPMLSYAPHDENLEVMDPKGLAKPLSPKYLHLKREACLLLTVSLQVWGVV